jgi:superfamily II DNA or RNA helicase
MKSVLDSVIRVHSPDPAVKALALEYLASLAADFPDCQVSRLGGIVHQGDEEILWLARGLRRFAPVPVENATCGGVPIPFVIDASQLDERASFQAPLVSRVVDHHTEGIIVGPTGSGKTVIEAMIVGRIQRPALILTHTTPIADQIRSTLRKLTGTEPGFIGAGQRILGPVMVGLIQSVRSTDPILKDIALLIIDEAHHLVSASYLAILEKCPARYRYGLTATIRMTGEKEKIAYAAIGPLIATLEVKDLQTQKFLNTGVVRPVFTTAVTSKFSYVAKRCWYYRGGQKNPPAKCPAPCTYPQDDDIEKCVYAEKGGYFVWVYKVLSEDAVRNEAVVAAVSGVIADHPWMIVLTHLKDHARLLAKMLSPLEKVRLALGPGKSKETQASIADYVKDGGILVATSGIIGEGFNAPKTSCLVRAMPSGGKVSVRQQTGRIMRPQEKPALVIDFVDIKIPWLRRMWFGRRSIYKTIGFKIESPSAKNDGELFA